MGHVSTEQEGIDTRTRVRTCMYGERQVCVSDICALTFKRAALTGEGAECDYRSGKRKDVRERRERRSSRERIVLNYHPLHIPDFS